MPCILLHPRARGTWSAGSFLADLAREFRSRGLATTQFPFDRVPFSPRPWDAALLIGVPRFARRVLASGKPVVLTMGLPEHPRYYESEGVPYLPSYAEQELVMLELILESGVVVFNSQFTRETWESIFAKRKCPFPMERVRVVHHGLDTSQFAPPPSPPTGVFTIGAAGTFRGAYRMRMLLEACAKLPFDFRLLICGELRGDCQGVLDEYLRTPMWQARISRIDALPRERMPQAYAQMHCLAHPVDFESFSLTIAEALSCGVPVVVPDQGAPKEFVGAGGVIVPVRQFRYDDEFAASLAAGIAEVREKWQSLRQAARQVALTSLSISKTADAYLAALRETGHFPK